jgi:hypothetical protein
MPPSVYPSLPPAEAAIVGCALPMYRDRLHKHTSRLFVMEMWNATDSCGYCRLDTVVYVLIDWLVVGIY